MTPRGVPLTLWCPKCHRGPGCTHSPTQSCTCGGNLEATGRDRGREIRSREARDYHALRVEMRCKDCGHTWWSVHPDAERYLKAKKGESG